MLKALLSPLTKRPRKASRPQPQEPGGFLSAPNIPRPEGQPPLRSQSGILLRPLVQARQQRRPQRLQGPQLGQVPTQVPPVDYQEILRLAQLAQTAQETLEAASLRSWNEIRAAARFSYDSITGYARGSSMTIKAFGADLFRFLERNDDIATNRSRLRYRDEVEAATRLFNARFDLERRRQQEAKDTEEATRKATRAAIIAQDEFTRAIQRSTAQYGFLVDSIQRLFDAVNQGTRSGGQGVSGFGSGFIQFTNTLIALGETVATVSGSRLFHNPANDRLAEIAGFRVGSAGAVRAASRQSALDFSNSFGRGFERAQRASAGPVDNRPIELRTAIVVNNKTTQEVVRTINRLDQSYRTRIRR